MCPLAALLPSTRPALAAALRSLGSFFGTRRLRAGCPLARGRIRPLACTRRPSALRPFAHQSPDGSPGAAAFAQRRTLLGCVGGRAPVPRLALAGEARRDRGRHPLRRVAPRSPGPPPGRASCRARARAAPHRHHSSSGVACGSVRVRTHAARCGRIASGVGTRPAARAPPSAVVSAGGALAPRQRPRLWHSPRC